MSNGTLKPGSVKADQEALLNQVANSLKESNKSADLAKGDNVGCCLEMYSDAKACSKEMLALFGSSGIPSPDRLEHTKETNDRLPLSDDPFGQIRTRAMLVVHVVDSGIGLSGIIYLCFHRHLSHIITRRSSTVVIHQLS